jgi:zinc protease
LREGKLTATVFVLLLFFSAGASGAGLVDKAFETELDNGLKVILLENRKAPVVSFHVWYRAGSRHDPWGKSGLAHLFEHLMFKGTKKVSGEEFTRTIQKNGGNYNAFTSYDFAGYFETLASDRIEIAVDLESDRMQNLAFTDKEFETERKVVMEERRLRTEDDPKARLMEEVTAAAFRAQPYQWPVIGWMSDLERITVEDARSHYERYYHPANAFIVVAGKFQKEELLQTLGQFFGAVPAKPKPPHPLYKDPPQSGERRIYLRKEAKLPFVVMGHHVPTLGHPDCYTLEVIAAMLSSGKSSRFHQNLVREKGLVVSANAHNPLLSIDPDLFRVSAEALPKKDICEVEEALVREMERLQDEEVEERELEKVKNRVEASFVFGQDSLFMQAMFLARFEIAAHWKEIENYIPRVREVSPEDIRRVARQYLVPENRTVGLLVPPGYKNGKGDGDHEGN